MMSHIGQHNVPEEDFQQKPVTSSHRKTKHRSKTRIALLTSLLVIGLALITWIVHTHNKTIYNDPFPGNIKAVIDFPLYYPTSMPKQYRLQKQSVTIPQPGVVALSFADPKGNIIYMSEESRPSSFDFGGYYNGFAKRNLTTTSIGTIATGYINSNQTVIASLATNKTWIIANTKTNLAPSQLREMLHSLAVSH